VGTGNLKYDIRKSKANHFSKKEASFYKLSNKQIAHLIDYLVNDFNQEELNSAIGYTCNCPYCSSRNIYKIESNSNLYKFKCETCNKKFTNLSKSVISDLLKQEYIKKYNRFTYKNTLKDIEVWFCFDVEHEWRRFNILERKNFVSTNFRWRHNIIQIPKELRNNKLTNIYECDEKGFLNLVNSKINKTLIKKKKSNTRFIVLTFLEGKYVSSQSVDFTNKQFMKIDNLTLNSYKNEVQKKKAYQKYISLQECLMQSYNKSCETLKKPNREDKVYKDIETPYKHTYILAYEMAIRNSDVKRILYILQYLRDIQQKLLLINNQYSKEQNSSIAIACKAKKNYDENINHVREELLSKYPNYMNSNLHKEYLSIGYKLLTDLINDFEERLQKNYLIIPKKNKIITPEANRIKMQRVIHNSIDPKNYSWSTSKQAEEKYKFEETVYDEYVNSMGVFQGDDQFDVNVIRPTFNLHLIDNNYSYIPVNLTYKVMKILLNLLLNC
jgi:DNA-directed RNA polymerase subunit RPC12/RpoP